MAKASRDHKTNALRELDAAGIAHEALFFEAEATMTGVEIARAQGEDPDAVFKTLVTQGKSGEHYVFLVPVASELDLKKAAAAAGEKAVAMIKARELLPLTGYVHGGCSPLGMKKPFVTFIDETAQLFDEIYFSGGKIGCQIRMNPDDLARLVPFTYADLTV
ncbi:MAG: Cys-tRNA(Pro) deacylase [Adlercreutzia sp.]|nr:Cys-tRNA(Pro) deacylase [Adlercreutzia sp.]